MTAKQRVHRILKAMSDYRSLDTLDAESARFVDSAMQGGEHPIGVYVNDDPLTDPVIIAEEAFLMRSKGQIVRIRYEDITTVQFPPKDSLEGMLEVTTNDGKLHEVHIDGGSGKFRDLYEFGRFLMRVRDDAKQGIA